MTQINQPTTLPDLSSATQGRAQPPKRRWTLLQLILLGLLPVMLLICILGVLVVVGLQEINRSPLLVQELRQSGLTPDSYVLSSEQAQTVTELGYPDTFTILFYDDDYGGGSTRLETWVYSEHGTQRTFVNGSLEGSETFEPLTGRILPAPYQPEQFTAYMSLEAIVAATAIDEFLVLPLEKELVDGGESYFADRLIFGMKDGELMFVEAVGHETDE